MSVDYEQYLIHPIEKPLDDSVAKVDLIRSKDHPIMNFFYESCFYRHDYVICDKEYALPYEEFFSFVNTARDDNYLGATLTMDIAGKQFVTDRCCMISIPAFVPHGHISLTNMTSPVFSAVTGSGRSHASLPEALWDPDSVLPIEEMVQYHSEASCERDPHKCVHQHLILRSTPGTTTKGEMGGSVRRYYPTEGWEYVKVAHLHATPEVLGYYGADPWHPYELKGTYYQSINGETIVIDRPTVVFLPPYLPHCPIVVGKVEMDNYWTSTGLATGPESSKPAFTLNEFNLVDGKPREIHMEEPW